MADLLLGGIVINEILVDPNGASNFDTDGNGTAASVDEYIELYNTSGGAIDIGGLELWDAGVGHWFTFPIGTILQPGGHAMVMSGVQFGGSLPIGGPDDIFFDAGRAAPLINNGGDNVVLYDPGANEYISATFNGDALDDPTLGGGGYSGFSGTATQSGAGEDFGNDTDGLSLQRASDGTDIFTTDAPTPGTTNICYADGTMIATINGLVAVEDLSIGDKLMTADHGPQPIRWIWGNTCTSSDQQANPKDRPVRIRAGALGRGLPSADLFVSQNHRLLVCSNIARRMFGASEVLVPAKALVALRDVEILSRTKPVTYFHILLDQHQIIFAEDAPSESLFLGEQTLLAIGSDGLIDLSRNCGLRVLGQTSSLCRPKITVKQGQDMAIRHHKNNQGILGNWYNSVPSMQAA